MFRDVKNREERKHCPMSQEGARDRAVGLEEKDPNRREWDVKALLLSSQSLLIFLKCFGQCFCNHSKKTSDIC